MPQPWLVHVVKTQGKQTIACVLQAKEVDANNATLSADSDLLVLKTKYP